MFAHTRAPTAARTAPTAVNPADAAGAASAARLRGPVPIGEGTR